MNVTAMAAETTATVEEIAVDTEDTAVVTEETTQELVPMMAAGCAVYGGVEAGHNNCHSCYDQNQRLKVDSFHNASSFHKSCIIRIIYMCFADLILTLFY